jgi:hypothetical protein
VQRSLSPLVRRSRTTCAREWSRSSAPICRAFKLHTGGESAKAATGLGARAFTVGQDVHFGSGEFAPGTKEGDKLIAHELTHTVQAQKSGIQQKSDGADEAKDGKDTGASEQQVSEPPQPAEKEADAVADHVADDLHGDDAAAGDAKHSDGDGEQLGQQADQDRDALLGEFSDEIFEEQLRGWWTDETTYPANRTLQKFQEWFDVEFHSMVFDLGDYDLETEPV